MQFVLLSRRLRVRPYLPAASKDGQRSDTSAVSSLKREPRTLFIPASISLLFYRTPPAFCVPSQAGGERGGSSTGRDSEGPTSMDPQAKNRSNSAAVGGCSARLASLGADGGDSESGAGSEEAVGCCSDTFSSLPDMEQEALEEKLRGLAFRKQTSYR